MTGDEIIAIRSELGLTQREAAALLGVGRRTWQQWESELYVMLPPAERLLKLLAECPCVREWLVRYEEG